MNKLENDLNNIRPEQEKIANEFKLMFFECSAKSGINIDTTFNELIKKTVENYSKIKENGETLKRKSGKKKGCC